MKHTSTVVLRDAGGFLIGWVLLGIPLGIPADMAWNWLGFRLSTRSLHLSLPKWKTFLYVVIITAVGLWVDIPYVNFIWSVDWMAKSETFAAEMPFALQLASILMPTALLAGANFGLGMALLGLRPGKSLRFSIPMAVITAPWAVLFGPYLLGWAI